MASSLRVALLGLALLVTFGVGAAVQPLAQRSSANPVPAAESLPQRATTDMLRRVRVMLVHYWSASFDALQWRQEFKPLEAWETAAIAADFRSYLAACDAIAAQRKADPAQFDRLYNELRAELEKGYLDRVSAHLREVAGR